LSEVKNSKIINKFNSNVSIESQYLNSEQKYLLKTLVIDNKLTIDFLKNIVSIHVLEPDNPDFHNILQSLFKTNITIYINYFKNSSLSNNEIIKEKNNPQYICTSGKIIAHVQYNDEDKKIHKLDFLFKEIIHDLVDKF
jgi:hypothetical protein